MKICFAVVDIKCDIGSYVFTGGEWIRGNDRIRQRKEDTLKEGDTDVDGINRSWGGGGGIKRDKR